MNDQAPVPVNEQPPAARKDTPLEQRGGPIHRIITQPPKKKFWSRKRIWWIAGSAVGLIVFYLLVFSGGAKQPTFVTADVVRGPLTVTVSATGTLQPVNEVDVGAEISGRIAEVLVDYNDHVGKGQVLARIDTEQLAAKLAQSRASLASAEATVRTSDATLAESRAKTARVAGLFKASAVSRQELETAQADLARAVATLAKARADAALAAAQVTQDQTTLSKAEIRAPIDGIVLTRNVEPGQTLASAFATPILFTLASDLSEMELKVDIDEADIGTVREGQHATFTVDAFPQRRFGARLTSLHNAPKSENGVVTYQGVLTVDNSAHLLRPGLTANADILVASIDTALLVPNGALRFTPPDDMAKGAPPPPAKHNGELVGRVWVLNGVQAQARDLRVGRSDGRMTEVIAGNIRRGDKVITDITTPGAVPAPGTASTSSSSNSR
jgi:HlyD family secretion protein